MTKVAIVILNWNGRELLKKFLPSVVENTSLDGVDIIVADNASTDDSISFLHATYPNIRIIQLEKNYGFAEGYNRALSQISSEYYVLLNSDVELTPNWLDPLVCYLDNNITVAALQPKILSQREKQYFEYAGASGGYIDQLGFPFCRGRIFGTVEDDKGQYDEIKDIFWASGACMLIRSKDYFDVGGLDEKFFAHMEEIDLCWRLKARGRRIVCVPESIVYHVGGGTLGKENAHKVYLNFRNNMLMLYKNLSEQSINKIIRKRAVYNWIAAFQFILSGDWQKAKAVFRAHKDFKSMKKSYASLRSNNISKTLVSNINEMYKGNIIIDYYLKGIKEFSKLKF